MSAFPTSTTVLDSVLFRDAFGTSAMREVFSDLRLLQRYAEVEVALARLVGGIDNLLEESNRHVQVGGVGGVLDGGQAAEPGQRPPGRWGITLRKSR